MYLDDSATHGAVLDKQFAAIPVGTNGFMPVTSAGGILVRCSQEKDIRADLTDLRRRIKRSLKTDFLPEIHMRHMWGREVPRKKNPFFNASYEDRFRWCKAAYDILFRYGNKGYLQIAGVGLEIEDAQMVMKQHYDARIGKIEDEILKYIFPLAVDGYYQVILNPLCRMIMSIVVAGNYFAFREKHTLDVFYDTSGASKGFSLSSGMQLLLDTPYFSRLNSITESTPHDHDLLQLADVAAYATFRKQLMQYRRRNSLPYADDEGMRKVRRNRPTEEIAMSLPSSHGINAIHENQIAMLHIVYAAQKIRDIYPELAESYLADPGDYDISLSEPWSKTGFFQLFRHEVIHNWINGKRPPL